MTVRPLFNKFVKLFVRATLFSTPIGFPVVIDGDSVIVNELISAHLMAEVARLQTGFAPIVTLTDTRNGTLSSANVCLFTHPLAQITQVAGGASTNETTPLGTVRFDFSDGRGNGMLIPVNTLWLSVPVSSGLAVTDAIGLNLTYRQKAISVQEFEALKSTFG